MPEFARVLRRLFRRAHIVFMPFQQNPVNITKIHFPAKHGFAESGFDDLLGEVSNINEEASKNADGWPKELPDYPDGTMNAVETYRTEFTGTSRETMMDYIDTLKKKGYEYQDFYEFGMTEEDMLGMDGWWGTNGKLYLSFSYYEGTVTVDHTTELPDLSGLFG